jgi:hypothetical protein
MSTSSVPAATEPELEPLEELPRLRAVSGERPSTTEGFVLAAGPLRPYAMLTDGERSVSVRLARVGTSVVELAAETVGIEALDGREVRLQVASLFAPVVGWIAVLDEGRANFFPEQPDPTACRQLFAILPEMEPTSVAPRTAETISEPRRIQSILRALVVNGTLGRIRAQGRDWIVTPEAIEDDRLVWRVIEWGGAPTSPLVVECSGYGSSYAMPVLLAGTWTTPLVTTVPRTVRRMRHRRMPRTNAPDELTVRFEHPTFGHVVERRLCDLSDEGLGIRSVPHEDLLCPGLELPRVTIVRAGKTHVADLHATVRSLSPERDRVGLATLPLDGGVFRDWNRVVRELLHERTRSYGYSAQALWELYESAGYLALAGRTPDAFVELKTAFRDATERLLRAPDVGYHVVWPSERGLDAAVANVLVYSRAHLGFQMAKRPGKSLGNAVGKEILRDIHWHTLEEALASSQSDWWIGYVQPGTRFSNLLCCEFQARFRDPARECVVPIHPYKIPCEEALSLEATLVAHRVRQASDADLDLLASRIEEIRPKPYVLSQDLTRDTFRIDALVRQWGRVGLERAREIFVAYDRHGKAQAALVLELAHPGLHLYGLMDLSRIYALTPEGSGMTEALLHVAESWYASRGRKSFVHFHEGEGVPPQGEGVVSMGSASLCVISMELIPDLLDHLFEHMSWDPSLSMPPPAVAPVSQRPPPVRRKP